MGSKRQTSASLARQASTLYCTGSSIPRAALSLSLSLSLSLPEKQWEEEEE